jgi:hypothetical protein
MVNGCSQYRFDAEIKDGLECRLHTLVGSGLIHSYTEGQLQYFLMALLHGAVTPETTELQHDLQQATFIETFIQGGRDNETALALFKELVCLAYKLPPSSYVLNLVSLMCSVLAARDRLVAVQ